MLNGESTDRVDESGTKFMLDQTAVKFVRARLRAATIADWILGYYSWSQESYHGADRDRFLRCAQFYVEIIEKLEISNHMSELRRAISSVQNEMTAREPMIQGGGIMSSAHRTRHRSQTRKRKLQGATDKLAVLKQFESHLYSDGARMNVNVVNGKTISVLDRHAKSYMEQRAIAHLARQQAGGVSLVGPGLPRMWASAIQK